MRSAIVASLAAISFVFSGCFQDDSSRPTPVWKPPAGLAALHRSSFSATKAISSDRSGPVISAREYALSAPSYVPGLQDVDLPQVFTPDAALHLASAASSKTFAIYESAGANISVRAKTSQAKDDIAGLIFNASFTSLFTGLFNRRDIEVSRDSQLARDAALNRGSQAGSEDLPNPFAEAKRQSDAEKAAQAQQAAAADPTAQGRDPSQSPTETPAPSSPPQGTQELAAGSSASGKHEPRLLFLGDFDGTGVLKPAYASRVSDSAFVFPDASRTFVILSNSSAVEGQRCFAVEDMNGDGNMDLLASSAEGLFGVVFNGDGSGTFRIADWFLTGYEPTIAVPGPMGEGGREIVSVNVRNGLATVFRPSPRYTPYRRSSLGFIPDYIEHLVDLGQGLDYFLAAQSEIAPRLYQWTAGDGLTETPGTLPAEPGIRISGDPRFPNGMGALHVYQVGPYASIILTNAQGRAFNVANLRVTPQIFLVFGDIDRRGNLDVGIAYLVSIVPIN